MKKLKEEQLHNIADQVMRDIIIKIGSDESMRSIVNAILNVIVKYMIRYQEELEKE